MQNTPPALAKTSWPKGNHPLLRPRLFARLDAMRRAPMIWVAGPPGAGKTTLIASWLCEAGPAPTHPPPRPSAHLWYQLDADDADPASFFHHLGLAVRRACERDDLMLPALTPQYLPSLSSFTRRYAEIMGAVVDPGMVLVLDDYEQLPEGALLHGVVCELAGALPRGMTIVVLSRAGPPPAFARLQLHEGLALLEGHELNLTRDEALAFASARLTADQHADRADIEQVLADTHGWLAGFTLLMAEGRRGAVPAQPSAQTEQLLFDYFATELFERFPSATRDALLRTALMPTMTPAQAECMAGQALVVGVLGDLHRQNCFVVRRGHTEPVYEYHALFRAFLMRRGAATLSADTWRTLQCRAAGLLAASGQSDAAAGLYRAAGDADGLATLALGQAAALISSGRHRTLALWLSALLDEAFDACPWLHYWRAVASLPFDAVAARADFGKAYAGFQRSDDATGLYSTWAGAMESFFFEWRDFTAADGWIAEFEHLRERHPDFPSRDVELRVYLAMGTLLHRQPQHRLLPAWAERGLALLDPSARDMSVVLGGYLIIWRMWRGEAPRARAIVEQINPWIGADMSPVSVILWSCAVAFYHSVRGESKACGNATQAALDLAKQTGLHTFDFLITSQIARSCVIAGEQAQARTWLAAMAKASRTHSQVNAAQQAHLNCNLATQRGNWQQAIDEARGGMAMAYASGIPFLEAHCHIDLARALLGGGDAVAWVAHVEAADAIGRSAGLRVIEYLCTELRAEAAFRYADTARGLELLRAALALSRTMDGPAWMLGGPLDAARLYDRALAAGIEADHVRELIRRRALTPPEPSQAADAWPWPIRIYTLGRFTILRDDEPLRATGKVQHKPLELLKCLCAYGGYAVNQDRVTDALWPDSDAADQALRTTLHRLRVLLRHDQAVRLEDRQLHLDPRFVWVDCLAFDRAAHHPEMAGAASLQQALARYRGPFLQGESATWALAFRERLRADYLRMAERLGELRQQAGDDSGAVDCYLRVIEVEPLAEFFYCQLMSAYARLGRRSEALALYQRCRQILLSRLGVSPGPQMQALQRQLAGAA